LDSEESAEESVSLIDAIGFLNYANEQSVVIILENNRNPAAAQSQNSIIQSGKPFADGNIGSKEPSMTGETVLTKRLIGLFLLGYLLFNYPLISLVNLPVLMGRIPLLYIYIFGVWVLVILLAALITGREARTPE
jgi:hypothetical protein